MAKKHIISCAIDETLFTKLEEAFPDKPMSLIIESGLFWLLEKVSETRRPWASFPGNHCFLIDYDFDKAREEVMDS